MTPNVISKGIISAIKKIVFISVFLYFIYLSKNIISYLIISLIIVIILNPFKEFLKNKLKFKNITSTISSIIALITVLFLLIKSFIPLLIKQGKNLSLLNSSQLQTSYERLIVQYSEFLSSSESFLINSKFVEQLDLRYISDLLNNIISTLGSFSIGIFIVIFISFFLLKDYELILEKFKLLIPHNLVSKVYDSLADINKLLSRYFFALIIQILILFIIYLITLSIVGVSNIFIIAFLCALLNLIPYLGPIISWFLLIILTTTNFIEMDFSSVILPKVLYISIGFIIAQLIDNFVIQPFIFSKSVKSHPLEIFLVILIFGTIFGITGLIIAIPSYTILKVILRSIYSDNKVISDFLK
ncbi:MAG: AI-2E family transporter [Flavobacteriaceae bacterium]|nr:AI-2E family transporter [Flavobacteriaceae bacterium]